MQTHRPPISPLLVLVFGILAVSTSSVLIRFSQGYASSLVIAAYRLIFASLLLAPIALIKNRQELAALSKGEICLALLSGFFLALHFATWISSLEYTTVASSVVLVSTSPLWVGLLAPFTIKEPITKTLVVGMSLAMVGGTVVGLSDACAWTNAGLQCPAFGDFIRGQGFIGDLLALTGAIMVAGYLLIGRQLRGKTSLLTYIFLVYGMAAVCLTLIMIFTHQKIFGYPPFVYGLFLLLAVVPQLLGHTSFNWALRYLSAAYVSLTLLGEPVASSFLAYIILKETPTPLKIFGAILILAGIYVASKSGSEK